MIDVSGVFFHLALVSSSETKKKKLAWQNIQLVEWRMLIQQGEEVVPIYAQEAISCSAIQFSQRRGILEFVV